MGLHDRDYYRDDESGNWGDWLDSRGVASVIGITCAVFLLQLFSSPRVVDGDVPAMTNRQEFRDNYAAYREARFDGVRRHTDLYVPAVLSGEVWRFATAFWVHETAGLFGVLFGMLMIYFVGKPLEQVIGGKEFFAFYWYAGLFVTLGVFLGKLLEQYAFPDQPAWPFRSWTAHCGSLGTVTAVLMLFALKYWDQPVRFLFAITMPAWGAVALVLGIQFLFALGSFDRGEVVAASVFAILAAWVYHRSNIRFADRFPRFTRASGTPDRRLSRLKLVPPPDDDPTESDPADRYGRGVESRTAVRPPTLKIVDEQLEAKLDRVLDKVAKSGTESLSSEERGILLQASEAYKRRRGG